MLTELSIRGLALIESAEVTFTRGLNAVTGETGAGKSLLVASLELLRGETPRGGAAQWVRKGVARAHVEGRFEIADRSAVRALLEVLKAEVPAIADDWEQTLDSEAAELILGRSLSREGRTRATVQQRPVPLRALRAIAPHLLEIHGQNEHQRLLVPGEQLRLIDAFGGLDAPLAAYRDAREGWLALTEELTRLEAETQDRRDRIDLLRFQAGELGEARLQPGEHAALTEERELLRSAREIGADLGSCVHALREDDDALASRLAVIQQTVERWEERLPSVRPALEDLRTAQIHLDEATAVLTSVADGVTQDPARLEEVEERLDELERLEHKYRTDEAGLCEQLARIEGELETLVTAEGSHETLSTRVAEARATAETLAAELAKARRRIAPKLVKAVLTSLGALGLERARFDVGFTARDASDALGGHGLEDVELLLAANPGEELAPLRLVASGGEAARIMLALRTVLGSGAGGRTLVFDEIDAGVGGRLGPAVGTHLRDLGRRDQVLCVTHVPAIAAMASLHLCITKEVRGGRTRTSIQPLGGEERISEVADMIAGGAGHETARAEARRLIEQVPAR